MLIPRKFYLFIIFLLITCPFFSNSIKAQIIFRELPEYNINLSDSLYFNITNTRNIIPLNGDWQVYHAENRDKEKVSVSIPSVFEGNANLVFEKKFSLTDSQIQNHQLRMVFFGVNYSADFSVNGKIIYTHIGGEFPISFDLPRDILFSDKENTISVNVHYKLDAQNTIPLKQRFLFPKNYGGIFRDVFIRLRPSISINDLYIRSSYDSKTGRAKIFLNSKIVNEEFSSSNDTLETSNKFSVKAKIISPGGQNNQSPADVTFDLDKNKEKNVKQEAEISSPVLWTPNSPRFYIIKMELWRDGNLLDVSERAFPLYSLKSGKNNLTLNGNDFAINGVTYIPSNDNYGNLSTYSGMERDIKMIKDLGMNAIRFEKSVPNPYYLYLCQKYGILTFVEIPLNGIPEELTTDPNFIERTKNYFSDFLKAYHHYSIAGVGLGGSYLANSEDHIAYLRSISSFLKGQTNSILYASFTDFNIPQIDGLDMFGVELLNTPIKMQKDKLKDLQEKLGKGKVFISEATYLVNTGNSDGYLNPGSFEAQAKYFEDLLDYSTANPLAGYFINSMFDYRGEFASLIASYSKDNLYKLGICTEDRGIDRLGYKVIYSKLHNSEKVTIPIGSKSDTAPMSYILFGLFLALLMGALVNSGKKFREDASRALLRPYNFFADVRDQRIISGFHSVVLALVVAAVTALIISNFLSYLKVSVFLEKFLLAFGTHSLISRVSYLAWDPVSALIWLTLLYIVLIGILTLLIKAASFFIKNRIFLSSVFYIVVWSLLPMVLLIPVGIVLYRFLNADIANIYIYLAIILFKLWIFYRLMKGIYVIFDVNTGSVYFYSILIILLCAGGFIFYFQVNDSVLNYLHLALKQFNIGV